MRRRKRLTAKEQVLHIYPDAILLYENAQPPFLNDREDRTKIIVRDLPQALLRALSNDCVTVNFSISLGKRPIALSDWCFTEEECWENAWLQIQKDMLSALE